MTDDHMIWKLQTQRDHVWNKGDALADAILLYMKKKDMSALKMSLHKYEKSNQT